jgi:hypothetical protein
MSTPKEYLVNVGLQPKKNKSTHSRKESRLDKLANKIIPLIPSRDNKGEYVPYCTFRFHKGVIGNKKAIRCQEYNCDYFYKLYIPN